MHKLTRMTYSRNDWKKKARERADELREQRKVIARKNEKIEEVEQELMRAKQELELQKKRTQR